MDKKEIPKIEDAAIDFGVGKGGTYVLRPDGGISGKPFPSEAEAWAFDRGVKVLNKFMFLPYKEQLALLKQLEI